MKHNLITISVWFCLLFLTANLSALKPFVTGPQTSGTYQVRLYPMENTPANTPVLMTFGIPFPRNSITVNGLSTVRILKDGVEMAAYVDQLTPWRHITDPAQDNQSVRIARIQIRYSFKVSYPNNEEITIEWGIINRTNTIIQLENPQSGWHQVTSGSFTAADNVYEPDVYAILPKEILTAGILNPVNFSPLDDTVIPARDDPYLMDATEHWSGFQELDHSTKNFFYTIINEDDARVTTANQCHYTTDSEPWLYDRSSVMFEYYLRSAHLKPLREAVRNTQFYKNHIYPATITPARAIGLFDLKNPDPNGWAGGNGAMYSYNECFAYSYWLTGDDSILPYIPLIVTAHETNDEPVRWSTSATVWTERHTAFRLLANIIGYEITGNSSYKQNIITYTNDYIWHQNGAGGALPISRVDGALYHYGSQHGDGESNVLVASTWMSTLVADAMLRAYSFTGDANIASFIKRLAAWEKNVLLYDDNHIYDTYNGALRYPAYMIRFDGQPDYADGTTGAEIDHSLEIAAVIAWGGYFAESTGASDPDYKQKAADLYFSYDIGVNYWTRPAGPASGLAAFRVSPWRKYGWEYRGSGSLPWVLNQLGNSSTPSPTIKPTGTPTPVPTQTASPGFILGDVNSDNKIDMVDSLLIAQYTVDIEVGIFNPLAADVNQDQKIDVVDALLVAQYTVDLITEFPKPTPLSTPTISIIPSPTPTIVSNTYYIGPTRPYKQLKEVINLLNPGDLVLVDGDYTYAGGIYISRAGLPDKKVTLRGVRINNRRPVLSGGVNTIEFNGNHYIFEGFEVTGGSSRGIYHHANDITIRDVVVHDCPSHGILGADQDSGSLLIEYTEVYNCGAGDTKHQLYIATDELAYPGSVFRLQYCYIHDGNGGNNVKSRAERNEIYYNWIENAYYHNLELIGPDPYGNDVPEDQAREDSDIVGNVLITSRSVHMTRIGGDATGQTKGRYRFVNNTFIHKNGAYLSAIRAFDALESIEMHNNVFYCNTANFVILRDSEAEWTNGRIVGGRNNWVISSASSIPSEWTHTITGSNPGFIDPALDNYKLASGSPLINAGYLPTGSPAGHEFPLPLPQPLYHPPIKALIPPGTAEQRIIKGTAIDIGAFEQ